ncbi:MAG: monofunctional biosynthetic peptidoglycan transglycosylase, partial [Aquificota bacterium]
MTIKSPHLFIIRHKKLSFVLLILLVFVGVIFLIFPNTSWLKEHNPKMTNFMKLAQQESKSKIYQIFIPYHRIDKHLRDAIYLSEDASFWIHHGIDWHEIKTVVLQYFQTHRMVRGASTISQQVAKNIFLSPERSLFRKLKEYVYTFSLEYYLSKRRIFELYLNYAQFGKNIFGVEAASRYYFGHSADSVSVLEAASLAAILPAPARWSPLKPNSTVEKRIKIILERMLKFN